MNTLYFTSPYRRSIKDDTNGIRTTG